VKRQTTEDKGSAAGRKHGNPMQSGGESLSRKRPRNTRKPKTQQKARRIKDTARSAFWVMGCTLESVLLWAVKEVVTRTRIDTHCEFRKFRQGRGEKNNTPVPLERC